MNAAAKVENKPEPVIPHVDIPPAAPLRRPRSPAQRDERRVDNDARPQKRYGQNNQDTKPNYNNRSETDGFTPKHERGPRDGNANFRGGRGGNNQGRHDGGRKPFVKIESVEVANEDWGTSKKEESKPTLTPTAQAAKQIKTEPVTPDIVKRSIQKPPTVDASTPVPRERPAVVPTKPEKPLVPAKCLVDLVEPGSVVLISVDNESIKCNEKRPGFICLSLHEDFHQSYETLVDAFSEDCNADNVEFKPEVGDTFSIFDVDGWYRARLLNENSVVALIDASRLSKITEESKCRSLKSTYAALPEFSCVLTVDGVKLEDQLICTVQSRANGECKVSVKKDDGTVIGEGSLHRWMPTIEYPKPAIPPSPVPASPSPAPAIPSVPRPALVSDTKVEIIDVNDKHVCVRLSSDEAQKAFDCAEQGVALAGLNAKPLSEPPTKGTVLIAKFEDIHYRALCRRTNVKANKYLIEYVEYGNEEITSLDNLYPCPEEFTLAKCPAVTSRLTLHEVTDDITADAKEYLDKIKDDKATVLLSLPNGAKTSPSGSEAILTLTRNNENVNRKLKEMCTPQWKKMQERGGDVLESQVLMLSDLEYAKLPDGPAELQILDSSLLPVAATLSVCPTDEVNLKHAEYVWGPLTEKMAEYCNSELGREPYLPRDEELCIAKCPPYEQWYRAVKVESVNGAGSSSHMVLYVDFGNVQTVPSECLRKMQPEFVRGLPALAINAYISCLPEGLTKEALRAAREYLGIDAEGSGGKLSVTRSVAAEHGTYTVDAPGLLKAVGL